MLYPLPNSMLAGTSRLQSSMLVVYIIHQFVTYVKSLFTRACVSARGRFVVARSEHPVRYDGCLVCQLGLSFDRLMKQGALHLSVCPLLGFVAQRNGWWYPMECDAMLW